MKPANFSIRIPKPCREDWNNMQLDDKGKFCKACYKSVHDFSKKTPNEILDVLLQHAPGKVCGYFKETQLDRPLSVLPNQRLMSVTKRFALAIYLVFGSLLFSCKTIPEPERKPHIEWKENGPVFQKGRFTTSDLDADSARRIYGKADVMIYLQEEITDTVIMECSPNRMPVSEQSTDSDR